MTDINAEFYRMIAEMREYGATPAPSKGGSYNNLLRYREAREKILERFLAAFSDGYRLGKEDAEAEPLTIEQMREMNEPVWLACKTIEGGDGYWCLCRYGLITMPSGTYFGVDENPGWQFYRRPPEREEGHKMSTEYPCIYFEKDGVCRKLSSDTDFQCCVMGPCPEQKLSNADRIRAMSDEELSDIFLRADFCKCCEHEKDGACNYICAYPNIPLYDGCKQAALTWMKQPAEEDT